VTFSHRVDLACQGGMTRDGCREPDCQGCFGVDASKSVASRAGSFVCGGAGARWPWCAVVAWWGSMRRPDVVGRPRVNSGGYRGSVAWADVQRCGGGRDEWLQAPIVWVWWWRGSHVQ
jgi:hypothetical protein